MGHYDAEFYAGIKDGAVRSAQQLAPRLYALFQPRSVVDIGCGTGAMLVEFRKAGVEEIHGVDGDYVQDTALLIPRDRFQPADLSRPLRLARRYDLVITTEVAEHLPESSASDFVESLVNAGDVVVFSAAIPGQGGTNHINEQWPSYWARLFARHGLEPFDGFRQHIWSHNEIAWWYRQNILVFMKPEVSKRFPGFLELSSAVRGAPLDVAHPALMSRFSHTLRDCESIRYHGRNFFRLALGKLGISIATKD